MLPQIVHAHVHQLAGIQSAAALLRSAGGVRAAAFKIKANRVIGNGSREIGISVLGMPGKAQIQPVKAVALGHKSFSKTCFFCRTAKKLHRSGKALLLQIFFHHQSGSYCSGSQSAVPAAMAVVLSLNRAVDSLASLLA